MLKSRTNRGHAARLLLAALLAMLLLAIPTAVFAQDEVILEEDFSVWNEGVPLGWDFYSPQGVLEQTDGQAQLVLAQEGFAYLTQYLQLEPETTYHIVCTVSGQGISGNVGANLSFESQIAASGGLTGDFDEEQLELYVRTNTSSDQGYLLRVGLGSEDESVTGSLAISAMQIQKLEEMPADAVVHTLIGSIGTDGNAFANNTVDYEAADVSYNDIGAVLCAVLVTALLYLLMTSRWSGKLGRLLGGFSPMVVIFVAAFVLRISIAFNTQGHITDLDCFKGWSYYLNEYGLAGFYESGIFADYPPAYMYVLWVLGKLQTALGLAYDGAAFTLLIKLPAILADCALAYVVLRIARKRTNQATAALIAIFMLFAPSFIAVSCGWGQVDSVFTLVLVGTLWLLYRDKKAACAALWMLALLIKPQALLIAPMLAIVFAADLFTRGKTGRTLAQIGLSAACMAAVYCAVALPMRGGQSFLYVFERMADTTGQYAYGSVNAFNLAALLGGNFVSDANSMGFTSYRALGTACIILTVLVVAVLYFRKKDKARIFPLSALMFAAIYMLGHNMHERYILPAIVLMVVAAVLANSRRMMIAATAFAGMAFVNVYVVLIFGANWIWDGLVTAFSLLYLLAFAWLIYTVAADLCGRAQKPLCVQPAEMPLLGERRQAAAKQRLLHENPHADRRMTKRDMLVMLAITAVYAAVAFINLGSTVIPAEAPVLENTGDEIILKLEQTSDVNQIKYYSGYCQADFDLYVSLDGETYQKLEGQSIEHKYSNMFRWYFKPVEAPAAYVKLVVTDGYLELRELGLTDADGNLLSIASAKYVRGGAAEDAPALIDEQDQVPETTTYMTDMYFDEVYHARTAYEYIHKLYPYEITHPPLGKSIITLGIQMFGFNPFGWRFMGTLCGVLMLPVLYVFAKRIFKKTLWAAVASGLFALDFMHFVLTRIATIDSYSIFFILLMYLFMYEYSQHNFLKEKLSRTFLPLGLCGLSFALGAATKWICLYAGAGLAVLFFYTVYQRAQEYRYAKKNGMQEVVAQYKKKLLLTLLFCVGVFIVLPVAVYIASYIPYFHAENRTFEFADILKNQQYMFSYHKDLNPDSVHPYSSSVYTWPFAIRPVFFFSVTNPPAGYSAVIWCLGNPIIWWAGLAAVCYSIGMRGKATPDLKGLPFIAVAAIGQMWPWVVISREVFQYHYFATVPFLILALVYVMRHLYDHYKYGRHAVWGFMGACGLSFAAFYPAMTGVLASRVWLKLIQWLPTWPII